MEQNKEYYAFISYKREDEKWAKWLQNKLEHYKFPTNLNGRTDLPKHIRPTFRDVTDLTPGLLAEEIDKALRSSEWLIVICSPRSAKSPWVCKEAQTFIDLGRADHIIPFVIEGIPFSKDSSIECYPESLLNLTDGKELLAANINETGRDAAAIKVVARMFNLRFDTLWQRFEKEKKARRKWILGTLLFIIIVTFSIMGVLLYSNKIMKINLARAVSFKANQLIEQGDAHLARKLLLEILPDEDDLFKYPYVAEVEDIFRLAHNNNNYTFKDEDEYGLNDILFTTISPNGKFIGLISDGKIKIRNISSGECIKVIEYDAHFIVFSADNQMIVALSRKGDEVSAWYFDDTSSHMQSDLNDFMLKEHAKLIYNQNCKERLYFISFISNNILVSISKRGIIQLWDVVTCECIKTLQHIPANGVISTFSPDNKYIAISTNKNTIRIVDVASGQCIYHFQIENGSINSISFSSNNRYISIASSHKEIHVFDTKTGKFIEFEGHSASVNYTEFNSESTFMVSASSDNSVKLWNMESAKCMVTYNGHNDKVVFAKFLPNDSSIITSSLDKTIKIWDLFPQKYLTKLEGHSDDIYSIRFNKSGNLLLSTDVNSIKLWDLESGENRIVSKSVNDAIFSSDNKFIATYSFDDGEVLIWDPQLNSSRKIFQATAPNDILGIKIDPNNEFVAISLRYGTVKFLDINSGVVLKNYNIKTDYELVNDIAIDMSGRFMAIGVYEGISLIDIQSDECIMKFDGDVNSLAFSPDGRKLVAALGNSPIKIWDVQTGKCIKSFRGHWYGAESVRFSSDGEYIVSSSHDETVKIWDIETEKCIKTIAPNFIGFVHIPIAEISPNDKYIVTASYKGNIKFWGFKPFLQELINENKVRYKNVPLSNKEKIDYYLEQPKPYIWERIF